MVSIQIMGPFASSAFVVCLEVETLDSVLCLCRETRVSDVTASLGMFVTQTPVALGGERDPERAHSPRCQTGWCSSLAPQEVCRCSFAVCYSHPLFCSVSWAGAQIHPLWKGRNAAGLCGSSGTQGVVPAEPRVRSAATTPSSSLSFVSTSFSPRMGH